MGSFIMPAGFRKIAGLTILYNGLLFGVLFSVAVAQDDPFGIPDTLTVGSIEVCPNSSFSIPVSLFNDEQLRGLTIPLKLTGDLADFTCDSVIFNPYRTTNLDFVSAYIDNENKSFLLGIVPTLDSNQVYFEPGTGLLCEIFITVGDIWESEVETLTTAQLPPFNTLKLVGDSITPFVPEFIPGIIQINPTGIPDEIISPKRVAIEITAYPNPFNENLSLAIALDAPGYLDISIYNLLGQRIISERCFGSIGTNYFGPIQFSERGTGIYIVQVRKAEMSSIKKVIFIK
jgi:hypothetical protein